MQFDVHHRVNNRPREQTTSPVPTAYLSQGDLQRTKKHYNIPSHTSSHDEMVVTMVVTTARLPWLPWLL